MLHCIFVLIRLCRWPWKSIAKCAVIFVVVVVKWLWHLRCFSPCIFSWFSPIFGCHILAAPPFMLKKMSLQDCLMFAVECWKSVPMWHTALPKPEVPNRAARFPAVAEECPVWGGPLPTHQPAGCWRKPSPMQWYHSEVMSLRHQRRTATL